ncbi:MAG: ABC transporter ATP-binding protein [Oscillospiraceae bacterium]
MENVFTLDAPCFENMLFYKSCTIKKDAVTFITGASGTGKTTLLRLLNGTVSPCDGGVFYEGKNVADLDTLALRSEVVLVSQTAFLFDKTIRENFAEFYDYKGMTAPNDAEMLRFLHFCKLDFPLDADCTQMSGGERQRVFLAVTLSFMPKVLMLDEPTSALDEKTADEVLESLKDFAKVNKMTLIIVSHAAELCRKYADFIINLDDIKEQATSTNAAETKGLPNVQTLNNRAKGEQNG